MTKAKREALASAVKDAKTNAQALAEGAGVRILDTLLINGESETYARGQQGVGPRSGVGEDEGENEVSTRLVVGDIIVYCQVVVECAF